MRFRKATTPDYAIRKQVLKEALGRIRQGKLTYRHFIMTMLWGYLDLTDCQVPVGLSWPADVWENGNLPLNPHLQRVARTLQMAHITSMGMGAAGRASMQAEVVNAWLYFRSVELTDTPNWYKPSEDLIYSLAATNLTGVYAEDVRLPFPAIWLELPPGVVRSRTVRGLHDVRCVGMSIGNLAGYDKRRLRGEAQLIGRAEKDIVGKNLLISLCQEPLPGDTGIDDVSYSVDLIRLNDDEAPLHELCNTEAKFIKDGDNFEVLGQPTATLRGNKTFFNMIIGFLLYLTQTKDIEQVGSSKKRSHGQAKKKALGAKQVLNARTWLVGTKCKLDPEIKRAVQAGETLDHRHKTVVCGHWRRYRCGPRDDWHYEPRFIEPYVIHGDGPILGHSYE